MRSAGKTKISGMLVLAMTFACAGLAVAGETTQAAAGKVQVLSGGTGLGAREKLAEQARGYNLKLVFTFSTGNYLTDVPFQVLRGGTVIADEVAQGPWAFVKLPAGSYTVRATYGGLTQTRKVSVADKGQKSLPFSWPASPRVKEQPQKE